MFRDMDLGVVQKPGVKGTENRGKQHAAEITANSDAVVTCP